MAWSEAPVEVQIWAIEYRLDSRNDGDVIAEDREILDSIGLGLQHSQRG